MKKFYPHIMVACAFMLMFVNVGYPSTSFSVYQPYLVAQPEISHSGASIIVSSRALASLLTMSLVAIYYKKFNCRIGISAATLCTAIGFFLYSFSNNLTMYVIGSVVAGIGYGLGGGVGMTILISNWFVSDTGKALGITTIGSGVAGVVVPFFAKYLIDLASLQVAFAVEAMSALVIAVLLFLIIRNKPDDISIAAYGAEKIKNIKDTNSKIKIDNSESKPLLPKFKYRLFLLAVILIGSEIASVTFISVLLTSNNYDFVLAALAVSITSICLSVGKPWTGFIFDKFGTLKGTIIQFAILILGNILLCFVQFGFAEFSLIAVGIFGFGTAIATVGISKWSLEFSRKNIREKVVRDFQAAYAFGGFVFGMVPGFIAEFTNEYNTYYFIQILLIVISFAIIVYVYPHNNRNNKFK